MMQCFPRGSVDCSLDTAKALAKTSHYYWGAGAHAFNPNTGRWVSGNLRTTWST